MSGCLTEKSRRLWAATEAQSLGRGGITIVYIATGIDSKTIRKGIAELNNEEILKNERIRNQGGGRKKLTEKERNLERDLKLLLEPVTRGEPESPLLWTSKSTHKLAEELRQKGYKITQPTVRTLLSEFGYRLQSNRKTQEGNSHPDRNQQFQYINKKTKLFQKQNQPIISVDTKKKEKIGNFKNEGRESHQKGQATSVDVYDFIDKDKGKVAPYGVDDLSKNNGWVSVGISSDTAQFAINSIRSWWNEMGSLAYPNARKLYINADCGGSNGYRNRLGKLELQKLANEINLIIHVSQSSHLEPVTGTRLSIEGSVLVLRIGEENHW